MKTAGNPKPYDRPGHPFAVALTADFFEPDGQPKYQDIGLALLESAPQVTHRVLEDYHPQLRPEQTAGFQGIIVLGSHITAESVSQAGDLLAIGRFGVGYDSVDVDACTRADVAVIIASGAVDYSVAEATIGWMIALGHHLRTKDRLMRTGRWDDRTRYMGIELRDRRSG